jgi:hypothetical protein
MSKRRPVRFYAWCPLHPPSELLSLCAVMDRRGCWYWCKPPHEKHCWVHVATIIRAHRPDVPLLWADKLAESMELNPTYYRGAEVPV